MPFRHLSATSPPFPTPSQYLSNASPCSEHFLDLQTLWNHYRPRSQCRKAFGKFKYHPECFPEAFRKLSDSLSNMVSYCRRVVSSRICTSATELRGSRVRLLRFDVLNRLPGAIPDAVWPTSLAKPPLRSTPTTRRPKLYPRLLYPPFNS